MEKDRGVGAGQTLEAVISERVSSLSVPLGTRITISRVSDQRGNGVVSRGVVWKILGEVSDLPPPSVVVRV